MTVLPESILCHYYDIFCRVFISFVYFVTYSLIVKFRQLLIKTSISGIYWTFSLLMDIVSNTNYPVLWYVTHIWDPTFSKGLDGNSKRDISLKIQGIQISCHTIYFSLCCLFMWNFTGVIHAFLWRSKI